MKVHIHYSNSKVENAAFCNTKQRLTTRNATYDLYDEAVCARCRELYLSLGSHRPDFPFPPKFGIFKHHQKLKNCAIDTTLSDLLKSRRLLTKQFNLHRRKPKYHKPTVPITTPGDYLLKHPDCYLKEARAILTGKHWEGKNRCVKLLGDVEDIIIERSDGSLPSCCPPSHVRKSTPG